MRPRNLLELLDQVARIQDLAVANPTDINLHRLCRATQIAVGYNERMNRNPTMPEADVS